MVYGKITSSSFWLLHLSDGKTRMSHLLALLTLEELLY
jgi:hypothetical protein